MGTEIPQRCFIRYRLANAPCTPPRRRPHPCSRNLLWRGAGTWRNRASVRCRGGKLLRLVLRASAAHRSQSLRRDCAEGRGGSRREDRKSTRLNSSHGYISYAVFCLKKKTQTHALMLFLSTRSQWSTAPSSLHPICRPLPLTMRPVRHMIGLLSSHHMCS